MRWLQVKQLVCGPIVGAVCSAYPRALLLPDALLLEGVASGKDVRGVPSQLLQLCFQVRKITCSPCSPCSFPAVRQPTLYVRPCKISHTLDTSLLHIPFASVSCFSSLFASLPSPLACCRACPRCLSPLMGIHKGRKRAMGSRAARHQTTVEGFKSLQKSQVLGWAVGWSELAGVSVYASVPHGAAAACEPG